MNQHIRDFNVAGRKVRASFLKGRCGFGLGFDATSTSLGISLGFWNLDIFWGYEQ
jgi:hypothetical protein